MSVYKDRGRLAETVESVLKQSFEDFEFIIVDDGSGDDTYKKLLRFSALDKRVKIFKNEVNVGLTKSLYKGVSLSNSKYIARIDEGDVWVQEKLNKQVRFLESNPDFVIVGSQYFNFDESGQKFGATKLPQENRDVKKWLIGGKTPMTHPTIVFRNGLINYNSDATTSQDFELYLRLAFMGKMANLPDQLVGVLRPADAISSKKRHVQFFNHLIMHSQFIDSIRDNTHDDFSESGVDFTKKPLLMDARSIYMAKALAFLDFFGSKVSRVIKYFLVPDFIIYKIFKKKSLLRFSGFFE